VIGDSSDIVVFSLFGLLILSLLADIFCAVTWNKTYFTSGLMIFVKRIPVNRRHTNIPHSSLFEEMFHSNWVSSFTFKELDGSTYGFREKMLQFRLMRYTPVMHGLLTFDTDSGQVIVKGFANWYALAFSLIWLGMPVLFLILNWSIKSITFSLLTALGAIVSLSLIMGILYWTQSSRFSKVASFAAKSWARKYVGDNDRA
jgi:hypothetical protein